MTRISFACTRPARILSPRILPLETRLLSSPDPGWSRSRTRGNRGGRCLPPLTGGIAHHPPGHRCRRRGTARRLRRPPLPTAQMSICGDMGPGAATGRAVSPTASPVPVALRSGTSRSSQVSRNAARPVLPRPCTPVAAKRRMRRRACDRVPAGADPGSPPDRRCAAPSNTGGRSRRELAVQAVGEDRPEEGDADRAADLPEEDRAGRCDAHHAKLDRVLHREHEHLHHHPHTRGRATSMSTEASPHRGADAVPREQPEPARRSRSRPGDRERFGSDRTG